LRAQSIEIGRHAEVRGDLRAEEIEIERNARVQNVYGKRIFLRSGASASSMYGEEITIESHCRVSGEIQYTHEIRVGPGASLSQTPQKVDKLPF
jgi:cytoskeletal protein CcmA (bactofilin family)